MASPFPGMDPYLESPENWRSFHHLLAGELMTALNQQLSPKYYADIEVHTIVDEIDIGTSAMYPDAAIFDIDPEYPKGSTAVAIPSAPHQRTAVTVEQTKLRAVRIYTSEAKELVTTIELLSPVNKRGNGLDQYRQKRRRILLSAVHFVEIDLLRGGQRPGWEVNDPPFDTDYLLLVNRAGAPQRNSDIWDVALNQALPALPFPLLYPDPDVVLEMQQLLQNIYQRAAYARRIDYAQPVPPPPLRPAMQKWWAQQRSNSIA